MSFLEFCFSDIRTERELYETIPLITGSKGMLKSYQLNPESCIYMYPGLFACFTKEFKQTTTATATRTANKRFNEHKNGFARAL